MSSIDALPPELLTYVLRLADTDTLLTSCIAVSRLWREITREVWKRTCDVRLREMAAALGRETDPTIRRDLCLTLCTVVFPAAGSVKSAKGAQVAACAPIYAAVRSDPSLLAAAAVPVLDMLSFSEEAHAGILEIGFPEVRHLVVDEADLLTRVAAESLVWSLCVSGPSRGYTDVMKEWASLAVRGMEDYTACPSLWRASCGLLGAVIARCGDDQTFELPECHVLVTRVFSVVQLLADYELGILLLAVCANFGHAAATLTKQGVTELVLPVMKRFLSNAGIQRVGCVYLDNVAFHQPSRITHDVTITVLAALEAHPANNRIQHYGVRAVVRIVLADEAYRELWQEADYVQELVDQARIDQEQTAEERRRAVTFVARVKARAWEKRAFFVVQFDSAKSAVDTNQSSVADVASIAEDGAQWPLSG